MFTVGKEISLDKKVISIIFLLGTGLFGVQFWGSGTFFKIRWFYMEWPNIIL